MTAGAATRLLDGDVQVFDVLDPRMPDLDEWLVREICASSASTSRCAVSSVESETMWSSTGMRSASLLLMTEGG